MANLISWLGGAAQRVGNTIHNDVVQPIQRDVVAPVQQVIQHPMQAPVIGGFLQADRSIVNAPSNLIKLGAADLTNNALARQNALTPLMPAAHTAQQFLRTVPEAAGTVFHPQGQFSYHPNNPIAKTLFGSTPVQNLQANVAHNYNAHANLNPFARVGLAGLDAAGQAAQIYPAAKGGSVAAKMGIKEATTAGRAIRTFDQAQNQIGAVGKNVGKPNIPLSPAKVLTPQERIAGRALGMSDKKIVAAKTSDGLQKSFGTIMSTMPPEEIAALKAHEQMAISNVMRHMGQQKSAVPPSVATSGDLPPVKPTNAFTELLSPKTSVLDKMGGSGTKIAQSMRNIEADKASLRSKWMAQIPTYQSLSKGDAVKAWDIKEGAPPQGASPKVLQAVKELRNVTPQVAKAGFDQGALVGDRGATYMPHSYDFKQLARGVKNDAVLQHLMDTQQVDYKTANQLFQDMARENARRPNRFGNFENARLTNLPGYSKSQNAFYNYLQGAATRTAEAKHFGLDNTIVAKHLDNLRIEGGDTDVANKTVENYLRSQDRGRGAGSLRATRGVFAAGSLSKAAISHAGQLSNTAVEAGVGRTLKGTAIRAAGGGKQLIRESGVTNPQELHAYRDQYTAAGKAMSKVTAPGLNPVMKFNRGSAALTGPDFANALLKKGNVAKVRSLGVTGKLGAKLTPAQELQAARGLTKDTMFGASRAETPLYAETKTGKAVGQFRTAYAYRQARFIKDQVINEARRGNIAPLARYVTLSAGVGAGTILAKNKISGSKEGPGGVAADTAAALGGIPGELLVQALRYGPRDVTKFVAGQVAPLAGEGVTTAENIGKAFGKNHPLAPLGRQALGHIPLAGGRISKAVLPPKNVPTSAQIANGAKQPVKGIYQVKGKDGSTKFTTLQSSRMTGFPSLLAAQTAQAKNIFKYSTQQTATINGQPYHKTAAGHVVAGPLPKAKTVKTAKASRAKTRSTKITKTSTKGFKTTNAKIYKPTGIKVKTPAAPKFASRTKKLSVSRIASSATRRKLG